jgi:C-terminal processing protease CtpA/Prc
MKIKELIIGLTILLCGCKSPESYLNEAIDIMEKNSVKKNSIDWIAFREDVLEKGRNAKSIKDTYPIIEYALQKLGDNHSSFGSAKKIKVDKKNNSTIPKASSRQINDSVGYIKIPNFVAYTLESIDEFAIQIQNEIIELDKFEISYLIVDLGENTGGNMWPMLLGLNPILSTGTLGYFVDADNNFTEWKHINGALYLGIEKMIELKEPYTLKNNLKKIAVITSRRTTSSGEAVLVALKGEKNVVTIGEETYGLSTCNSGFKLSDNSYINLTTSIFADRKKIMYGKKIYPDYYVDYSFAVEKSIELFK